MVHLLEQVLKVSQEDQVYFIGDYIDRGPGSRQVVDYLMEKQQEGYAFTPLRGNHEEMLVEAWVNRTPDDFMLWMLNGAQETLMSYDIDYDRQVREAALDELPEAHVDFLRRMPYYIELEDYILVHAGINFKASEPFQDTRSMVWCRDCENDLKKSGNRLLVFGHTPTPLELIRKQVSKKHPRGMNVDAGCVYKGYTGMGHLAALDLDHLSLYWQENIDF